MVTRILGKGSMTYIGAWSNGGGLERKVLQTVYKKNSKQIFTLAPYVFVEWRDGFYVAVNYSSKDAEIPVPENAKIVFGEKRLKPGEVTVWK